MIDLRNKLHLALPPVFLLALWIPALCGLAGYDPIPRPNENRPPAQFPAWPTSAATLQKRTQWGAAPPRQPKPSLQSLWVVQAAPSPPLLRGEPQSRHAPSLLTG